jgi:hypothetical protein
MPHAREDNNDRRLGVGDEAQRLPHHEARRDDIEKLRSWNRSCWRQRGASNTTHAHSELAQTRYLVSKHCCWLWWCGEEVVVVELADHPFGLVTVLSDASVASAARRGNGGDCHVPAVE